MLSVNIRHMLSVNIRSYVKHLGDNPIFGGHKMVNKMVQNGVPLFQNFAHVFEGEAQNENLL